jgi:hypothetical protein
VRASVHVGCVSACLFSYLNSAALKGLSRTLFQGKAVVIRCLRTFPQTETKRNTNIEERNQYCSGLFGYNKVLTSSRGLTRRAGHRLTCLLPYDFQKALCVGDGRRQRPGVAAESEMLVQTMEIKDSLNYSALFQSAFMTITEAYLRVARERESTAVWTAALAKSGRPISNVPDFH